MSGIALTTLENALYAWAKGIVPEGWAMVWDSQNAPKPGETIVLLRRGTPYIRKIGRDESGPVLTDGSRKILGTREMLVAFRALGPGAMQIAEDIRARLDDDTVGDVLLAGKLTVVQTGDINNLTSLYGSQFKEVADFEVTLRTHSLRESDDAESGVGYIETVDIDLITNPGPSQVVEEIHVERDP
jgi:hypothetical protein